MYLTTYSEYLLGKKRKTPRGSFDLLGKAGRPEPFIHPKDCSYSDGFHLILWDNATLKSRVKADEPLLG